jgi:DNA-binding beta-propeller fold protein YncE
MEAAMHHRLGAGLMIAAVAVGAPAARAEDYKVLQKATLGGEGGWDYITVDPAAHRLYIARATRVMVVDADTLEPLGEIPDTAGVHGVAVVPNLGRGFTSNGRAGTATVFDLKTLAKVGEVKTGENPDAILYEPKSGRVLTFNGRSHDATVIDPRAGASAGTIALGGKPEAAVYDEKGTVFVNIEDTSEIAALDPVAMKVKARWPLSPCTEPSGLAIDRAHRRLFAACDNKMMAVVDADSGKVVATPAIGEGTDGAAFDADRQLAFSTNGRDGTLTVVREAAPDKFEIVQTLPTARSARTVALDPVTHRVYTVAAQFGPAPSPTAEQPRPRPPVLPGTFQVIVVGR